MFVITIKPIAFKNFSGKKIYIKPFSIIFVDIIEGIGFYQDDHFSINPEEYSSKM